jgi:hypothetical protein
MGLNTRDYHLRLSIHKKKKKKSANLLIGNVIDVDYDRDGREVQRATTIIARFG